MGTDEISYAMVRNIQQAAPDHFPDRFTNLLRHGTFRPSRKLVECLPIPKLGQTDNGDPRNLRPISLLGCLSKTFEKILASRLGLTGELT